MIGINNGDLTIRKTAHSQLCLNYAPYHLVGHAPKNQLLARSFREIQWPFQEPKWEVRTIYKANAITM